MASPTLSTSERIGRIQDKLDVYPDFPRPGVDFLDIFPIMRDVEVFEDLISLLVEHIQDTHPDVELIMGLDARGFILGPLVAQRLGIGFAPIRKAGKLPGETFQTSYLLEYGEDKFEVQKSCVERVGQKVIIIDDLLATGGTMGAACKLMNEVQADILECIVVIELVFLNGRKNIPQKLFSLIKRE